MTRFYVAFSSWLVNKLRYIKMSKEEILDAWYEGPGQDFDNGISDRTFHRYLKEIPNDYGCRIICDQSNENRYHLEFDKDKSDLATELRRNAMLLFSLGIDPANLQKVAEVIQGITVSGQPERVINNYTNVLRNMRTDKEISIDYRNWDSQLWEKYSQVFKNVSYTITDGAIDPVSYAKSPCKPMLLNREPWDDEGYSLNDALLQGIKDGTGVWDKQKNLRKHFRQYLAVIKHCVDSKSFVLDESKIKDYVENTTEEDFLKMLIYTSYVNVKKSNGKSISVKADLREYAQKGIETLKEQIRYMNPSIILAGNIVDGVLDRIPLEWGETLYSKSGVLNIYQLKIDNKLYPFVDMKHPSAWVGMDGYYLEFFKALKQVEIEHPGFWEWRLNLECFTDSQIL